MTADHLALDCTIVQLTDTHIVAPGGLLRDMVDTTENLRVALERIVGSGRRVDALLLSGDLTDSGDPRAYRRLRSLVEDAAGALDAQIIYAMGNHDVREPFRTELLDQDPYDETALGAPHDTVHDLRGVRVITLDSTRPTRHEGWLSEAQLGWLRAQLATPSASGTTVLVMHHPPLRSAVAPLDLLRLQDADRLAEAISGTEVAMIVCGHSHVTGSGAIAGVPVWIGPAMSYRLDPFATKGRHRGFVGFGFSRIDVIDGSAVATAIEATAAEPVYDVPEEQTLARLRELAGNR
ncbi:metallophosphatase [Nocardia farcinica]|nr:metallophosphatase [Nocardia farcinica]